MLKPTAKPADPLIPTTRDLELFWPSGLALLCLLVGGLLFGGVLRLEGEPFEWAIYLTLGTIFPALLLALTLSKRAHENEAVPPVLRKLRLGLGLLCVLVSLIFIVRQHQYTALLISAVHLTLLTIYRKRAGLPVNPFSILSSLFVIVLAWTIAARLLWWNSFGAWFFSGDNKAETVYRFFVCGFSLLLVFFNLHELGKTIEGARGRRGIRLVAGLAAVLLIGLASVRSDQLFNTMSYSHWGVIVGPAEMVRQGGWLFWDVPSQYGFLNVLAVALLPTKSVWQSAYIINSFLLFASALFLFFVLRALGQGAGNFCFALLVTLAAIFLMAGWPPALLGPQVFPSLGPFRFIWCYALLLILFLEFRGDANREDWRWPLAGCIVWLVGTLWSSESAVYCAAIWLPSYALIIYRKIRAEPQAPERRSWLRTVIIRGLIPPLLLASSVGLITIYYLLRLGHAPDLRAFYEYSFAFTAGFFAIPIESNGPVWALFLIFCAFSTLAAYFLRDGLAHKAAALISGAWGALWAASSYFVSRSHPNNATVLSPVFCAVIAVALYLLLWHRRADWWAHLVRTSFVPILTIILTVTLGNAGFLRLYLTSQELGYVRNIDTHLPVVDPSLRALLQTAEVKADDPIIYSAVRVKAVEPLADNLSHDHGVMLPARPAGDGDEVFSSQRTWLPTTPFVLFAPLPEERRQIYMARFAERARLGGWLIQNRREAPYTSSRWFYEQVTRTHTPTKTFENEDWQVIWFEFNAGT